MWPWERSVSRMVADIGRHPEAESEIACREAHFQNRMELSRLTPYPWVAFFLCGMAVWFNMDGGGTPDSLAAEVSIRPTQPSWGYSRACLKTPPVRPGFSW